MFFFPAILLCLEIIRLSASGTEMYVTHFAAALPTKSRAFWQKGRGVALAIWVAVFSYFLLDLPLIRRSSLSTIRFQVTSFDDGHVFARKLDWMIEATLHEAER
jgi:hypothetical protein